MALGIYNVSAYGGMIADRGRTDAYAKALETIIRPTSVVLDIGTGAGVFALLAAKLGARKIYAVDSSDVIEVARELAEANGCASKIEFIHGNSNEIDLPEKVDVIVSDLRGVLPFFAGSLGSLIDARTRFLKPGGVMVPACDSISAAPVTASDLFEFITDGWEVELFGVNMRSARKYVLNQHDRANFTLANLVAQPQLWLKIDYQAIDAPNAAATLAWTIEKPAVAHGLAVWFDCETGHGLGFSNSPLSAERHIYGQQFFPFLAPIALESGDRIELELAADVIRGDYFWRWKTWVFAPDNSPKCEFRQSTLSGGIIAPAQLRKRAHTYVPQLNVDAEIDRFVLEQMAKRRTLGEIASDLLLTFPNRFADWQSALDRVADLSTRYAR